MQPSFDQFSISSSIMDKKYRVSVMNPVFPNQEPLTEQYPVVYLLDSNTIFVLAVEIIRLLGSTQEIKPFYLVGIGYDEDDLKVISNRRLQEFTPTIDSEYGKIWGLNSEGGEAGRFLRFIGEELKPLVQSKYSVDPDDATIAGDSLGGLFALYSLFSNSSIFQRYIIGSPAIFWDRGFIWKHANDQAIEYTPIKVSIFIGVGSLEDSELYHFPSSAREKMSHIKLIDDSKKMAKFLSDANYPGVSVTLHIFDGETHMSVIAPWLCRGFREMFKLKP